MLNNIEVLAVNGFSGVVTIEVLGLPAGVTSQTATSLNINSTFCCVSPPRLGASTPLSLKAVSSVALGSVDLTLRVASGSLVHTVPLRVSVVDALPSTVLTSIDVGPFAGGGTTAAGRVNVSNAAPAGGVTVTLTSSNPAVAPVPASVTVPAGATQATFTYTTAPVSAEVTVTISASFGGQTLSDTVTVVQPDTVRITRAEFITSKGQLQVEATTSDSRARLSVFNTSTGAMIGFGMTRVGPGRFTQTSSLAANPGQITVRSDLGGSATTTVTVK